MRRVIGIISATIFMLMGVLMVPQAANAYVSHNVTDCDVDTNFFGDSNRVCTSVNYRTNGGPGITVKSIDIWCGPDNVFEGDMQVNGYGLKILNDNGVVKWSRSDGSSNVTSNCHRSWEGLSISMPATNHFTFIYTGRARLQLRADRDIINAGTRYAQ